LLPFQVVMQGALAKLMCYTQTVPSHDQCCLQASALQCLPAAIAALAAALPVGVLQPALELHKALRALLTGVLDVPLGGVQQLAVEAAIAEEYARALSPGSHDTAGELHSCYESPSVNLSLVSACPLKSSGCTTTTIRYAERSAQGF
jgi:hypothetical protein